MNVGIIGLGFVGGSMLRSFQLKHVSVKGYDKFKNSDVDNIQDLLTSDILFLCLPTLFNEQTFEYDKNAIHEVCDQLSNYKGVVVIKSTVEPETTEHLCLKYFNLQFVHNPEFLTARTAFEDFHNQTHIVLGKSSSCSEENLNKVKTFYHTYYPDADISLCTSLESESMKIFCNSFYASKVMLFNEYYLLCQKNKSDFHRIKQLMLKNNWINPMHTTVPGPDGLLGYGGACFPKDTKALNEYMKQKESPNQVLNSVIQECDSIRNI
jgi:UDPglucose 6-dehydrogenase